MRHESCVPSAGHIEGIYFQLYLNVIIRKGTYMTTDLFQLVECAYLRSANTNQ